MSRLSALARPEPAPTTAGPAPATEERCDLCGEPLAARHRHMVDVEERRLMCVCRACTILFDGRAAGGGRLRLVPTRRRRLDDLRLDAAAWARLRLPVELAFLFHSSAAGRVVAVYPSPLGATESQLQLGAWDELVAAAPELRELEPDVEALLVCHARGLHEQWLVPIDDCYALVGALRSRWRGVGGGEEAWQAIGAFFEDLARREEER